MCPDPATPSPRLSPSPADPGFPVAEFVAPLPLLAVAGLVLNDHVLKGAGILPGWLTGKLSDLFGLFFFPLFLSALWGLVRRRPATARRLWICAGLTAAAFTALQLLPAFTQAYEGVHGWLVPGRVQVTADVTDLLALPMVVLAVLEARRRLVLRS